MGVLSRISGTATLDLNLNAKCWTTGCKPGSTAMSRMWITFRSSMARQGMDSLVGVIGNNPEYSATSALVVPPE